MGSRKSYKSYFSFIAGQNSSAAPDNLRDDEMRSIVNYDIITRGALKGRPGTVIDDWAFTATPSDTTPIDRLAEYPKASGTVLYLVLTGGNLYRKGSTTALLTGVGNHMDYTIYQDKMYILINNKYYVYDGTTIVEGTKDGVTDNNLSEIAKCKYIISKGERIYASGNPEAPTAFYYSQVGDPAYFKTGDFRVYANSGDGDAISALHEYQDSLLIFKSQGIWKYEGVSTATDTRLTKLNTESGTRAHRTIKNVRNYVFFLGNDGVYALKTTQTGFLVTEKVSDQVEDLLEDVQYQTSWWLNSAVAEVVDGKYILAFSTDPANKTKNTKTIVCHVGVGLESNVTPWTVYDGLYISEMFRTIEGETFLGDSRKQEIFHFDSTKRSDRGVAIQYKISGKDYDLDSPIHVKKVTRGWLIFRQYVEFETTIDLSVIVDYTEKLYPEKSAAESLVWDKSEWGEAKWGWIETSTIPFKIGSKGIRTRIEFTASSDATFLNEIFLYGFAFEYKTKRPIK